MSRTARRFDRILTFSVKMVRGPGTTSHDNIKRQQSRNMVEYPSYKLEGADNALVLEVTGRLDSSTSPSLIDCIQGYIERGEKTIVLDCSRLDGISSEGLAAFVSAKARLKKIDGTLSLAGVKGGVAEVIRIVHFDKLFSLFPSVDEAAKALE